MNTGKLSRRDFLRAAAAGAAGAAVTGVLPAFAEEDLIAPAPASDLMTWEKKEQEKWAFEVAPDPIPEADIRETIVHDVIVIGSGVSGLCCACSAQHFGTDVMLFSASNGPSGRGGSNHAIGSKYQQALVVDYTPETARTMVKVEQISGTYHPRSTL